MSLSTTTNGYFPKRGGEKMRLLAPDFVVGEYDVLCGRGSCCYNHIGNQRFRIMVQRYLKQYSNALTKYHKTRIICEIIDDIRQKSPEGGFIKEDLNTGRFYDVGDNLAREKISHTFRDFLQASKRKKVKMAEPERDLLCLTGSLHHSIDGSDMIHLNDPQMQQYFLMHHSIPKRKGCISQDGLASSPSFYNPSEQHSVANSDKVLSSEFTLDQRRKAASSITHEWKYLHADPSKASLSSLYDVTSSQENSLTNPKLTNTSSFSFDGSLIADEDICTGVCDPLLFTDDFSSWIEGFSFSSTSNIGLDEGTDIAAKTHFLCSSLTCDNKEKLIDNDKTEHNSSACSDIHELIDFHRSSSCCSNLTDDLKIQSLCPQESEIGRLFNNNVLNDARVRARQDGLLQMLLQQQTKLNEQERKSVKKCTPNQIRILHAKSA